MYGDVDLDLFTEFVGESDFSLNFFETVTDGDGERLLSYYLCLPKV